MLAQLTSDDNRVAIGFGTYASGQPLIRPHHPNNRVIIGKFCSLANDVSIFAGGNHPLSFVTTHPIKLFLNNAEFPSWTSDCGDGNEVTTIGNDVWLGHGCTILSGAAIGDGAIVGACTVVRGKIPPYAITIGNPATVIRYRFDENTINRLLALAWWDWPVEKIKCAVNSLGSNDLAGFLNQHQP
jgi:acetyltransferase-like isoleucine patch superfamily enzyme